MRRSIFAREVLVAVVYCLELAAVNRDAGLREQAHRAAQCDKMSTNFADGSAIVLAEVGNRPLPDSFRQAARSW